MYANRQGNVAHGVGDVGAFLNGLRFDDGGSACWFDASTIAYQRADIAAGAYYVALGNILTGAKTRAVTDPASPFYGKGCNALGAGGGVWAAWLAGFGLYTSYGLHLPAAGLVAVSPDGAVAYTPDQQTGYPVKVRERNGDEWLLASDAILECQLLGSRRAIWTDYANHVRVTEGLPIPTVIDGIAYRVRAALLGDGRWWMSYFGPRVGVVVHPFASTLGYSIVPVGDCWQDVTGLDGDPHALLVAWTTTQGEADLSTHRYNTASDPQIDCATINAGPPDPEPPDPPQPEPEPDTMKPPVVTVDTFTLDDVLDGREFAFHDDGNPDLKIAARVWVANGSMYASLTNKAGSAQTGATRAVHPCSQGTTPIPPEPPKPEPEPPTTFSLVDCFGRTLAVDADKFLATSGAPATFEEVDLGLPDGSIGLKANGKFCAAEGDNRVKADRDTASTDDGSWERWIVVVNADGTRSYRSWRSLYLSSHEDGRVYADMEGIGGWESFTQGAAPTGREPIDGPLTADSWFFRNAHGHPTRYQGITAFPLARRFADGVDIQPFLDCFPGANVARLFDYVTWEGTGWEPPSIDDMKRFLSWMRDRGWYVELCMLTDDDEARIGPADARVRALAGIPNLLIEIGNEPRTNKAIDTTCLKAACEASGLLYASGDYEDSKNWFGDYLTAHTPRDDNWPRKAHDLLEYHNGGGPSYPAEPACKCPCVADEPIRPDQANSNWCPKADDFRSYAATSAVLGAGATFHFDGGKYCNLPTDEDRACYAAFIAGLQAFPADVPGGSYRTIDEGGEYDDDARGSRTYIVGERAMVRVRPVGTTPPEPGWTPLDDVGICFARA